MSDFDPYLKWLGIRDPERPPNHYRLLGVEEFEADADVIAAAADRQMTHVRSFQNGPDAEASQKLLSELALARRCLMSPERKQEYDRQLELAQTRSALEAAIPSAPTAEPAPIASPTAAQAVPHAEPATGGPGIVEPGISSIRPKSRSSRKMALPVALAGCVVGLGLVVGMIFLIAALVGNGNKDVAQGDKNNNANNTDKQKLDSDPSKKPDDKKQVGKKEKNGNGKSGKSNGDSFKLPPWDAKPEYATSLPAEFDNESSEIQVRLQPVYFALSIREREKAERILNAILNDPKYNGETLDMPGVQECIQAVNHHKRFWANYEIALAGIKPDRELTYRSRFAKVVSVDSGQSKIKLQAGDDSTRDHDTVESDVERDLAISVVMSRQKKDQPVPDYVQSFLQFDFVHASSLVENKFDLDQVVAFAENGSDNPNPFGPGSAVRSTNDSDKKDPAKLDPEAGLESPVVRKLAIPSSRDRAAALSSIKKGYADLYASKEPTAELDLAKQLLEDADTDDLEPASKYAMLDEARRLFIAIGDPAMGMKPVDMLNDHFEIKYFDVGRQTLDAIARKLKTADEQKQLVQSWTLLWQKGLEREDFTSTLTIMSKALSALKRLGDNESHKKLQNVRAEVQEMKRLELAATKAREQLQADDADPAANLAVGKYFCFVKNDFASGLPHLSKGSDPRLKKAAVLELAELELEQPEKPLEIAESWFALGTGKGLQSKRLKLHAAKWYRTAEPKLDVLKQKEIQKILEEIDSLEIGFDVANVSGFGRQRFIGDAKWRIEWGNRSTWDEAQFTSDGVLTYYVRGEQLSTKWKWGSDRKSIEIESQNARLYLYPMTKKTMVTSRWTLRNRKWREDPRGKATALESLNLDDQ